MHPFRRYKNSQLSSHGSRKGQKDLKKGSRSGSSDDEDEAVEGTSQLRRISPSRMKMQEESIQSEIVPQTNIPVIRIGQYEMEQVRSAKKQENILKAKKEALWTNNSADTDNSRRLGPNTNNIILESLKNVK